MSELDVQIPTAFDRFAEANAKDSGAGTKEYVHIRIQQRNGRKSLTTVQGLKKEFSYNKILKELKKEFCKGQNTARWETYSHCKLKNWGEILVCDHGLIDFGMEMQRASSKSDLFGFSRKSEENQEKGLNAL
ncbi:hypothetical protein Droror1_Dr00025727 [Drosera rotundifolia]